MGREATPDLLLPLKRRRFRRPSPHRRIAGPFRLWLIGSTYRPSDGGGLHRSWLGTIFSRRRHASPSWSTAGNPHHRLWGERFGLSSALRPRAVSGAPTRPKMPSPGVTLPGPFVTPPSPVPPGGDALAAYLRGSCGVRARCSVRVRSRTGRLRRSVYPPFIASPFLLEVNLVPSHCGSRALKGRYRTCSAPSGQGSKETEGDGSPPGSPGVARGFPVWPLQGREHRGTCEQNRQEPQTRAIPTFHQPRARLRPSQP